MNHGNGNSHGNSFANGPAVIGKSQRDQGWDIKPVSHWDFTEGRLPR
jgi:hypothetical protein